MHEEQLDIALPKTSIPHVLGGIILAGIVFILALPLLGDYGMWMFPLGRDVIFKLAVELLWILFLLYWSLKNWKLIENWKIAKLQNLKSPITLSLLLFWTIMLISTLNSVQPDFSLWGNVYKNQGLMTWTHYVLFFFLLVGFLGDKKHWRLLINIAIAVATLVGLIALLQVLQNGFDYRVASTLNNSNYLAAYLVLMLPITFAFSLKGRGPRTTPRLLANRVRGRQTPTFWLLGSAVVIQLLALVFTQTRGGYAGIIVSIFIFSVLYFSKRKHRGHVPKFSIFNFQFSNKSQILNQKSRILLILLTILVIGSWLLVTLTSAGQILQQKLPDFTDRFLSRQNILSDSGPRLEAWRAGWQGMLKKPILGYGPENFFAAFDEHYSGSQDNVVVYPDLSPWEGWFDKAHNFIFDIGATMGFLGLFAYLAVFGSAVFVLFRNLRFKIYDLRFMIIGLIAALAGYLAQNLLGFDTIVPGIYLMFLLGYAHFISMPNAKAQMTNQVQMTNAKKRSLWAFGFWHSSVIGHLSFVILIVFIFLATLTFTFSVKTHLAILRANRQLNLAESFARNVGVEQAFAAFEKGFAYNAPSVNPNLRRRYAVIALAYYEAIEKRCSANGEGSDPATAGSDPDGFDAGRCDELFADSKKHLTRALELQLENSTQEWPRFTRNYIYAAQIARILDDDGAADSYFEKALELSPGRKSIQTEWNRFRKE